MDRYKSQNDIVMNENFEFLDKIEEFHCVFCKTLYKKQFRLSCDHFICQKCHNSRLKKCPTCNYYVEIKGALIYMELKIQKLQVRCVNRDCAYEDSMKNFLEKHKICLFSPANVSTTKDEVLQSQKSNFIEERLEEIQEPEILIEEIGTNFSGIQPKVLEVKMEQEIDINNVNKEPKINFSHFKSNYAEAEIAQCDDNQFKNEEEMRIKLNMDENYKQTNLHIYQEPFALNNGTNDVQREELFSKNGDEKMNGLEKTIMEFQIENSTLKKLFDKNNLEINEKFEELSLNNWKQIKKIREQFQNINTEQILKLNGLETSIDVFKSEILNKLKHLEHKLNAISKCIINEDLNEGIIKQQKQSQEKIKYSLDIRKSLLIEAAQFNRKINEDLMKNGEIPKDIYKNLTSQINEMENGISANSDDVLWCMDKAKKNELLISKMAEIVSNNSESVEELNRNLNQKSMEINELKTQLRNSIEEFNATNEKIVNFRKETEKMSEKIAAYQIFTENFSKLITAKLDENVESVHEIAEEVILYKDRVNLIGDQFSQQILNVVENIIELKEEFNEKSFKEKQFKIPD